MARVYEPSDEEQASYQAWAQTRPEVVRKIAERLEPWSLYRLKSTGDRVTVQAIIEDGTVRVRVSGEFNLSLFDRDVFGINPDDLTPCELPAEDELTGTVLQEPDEVQEFIDYVRPFVVKQ